MADRLSGALFLTTRSWKVVLAYYALLALTLLAVLLLILLSIGASYWII